MYIYTHGYVKLACRLIKDTFGVIAVLTVNTLGSKYWLFCLLKRISAQLWWCGSDGGYWSDSPLPLVTGRAVILAVLSRVYYGNWSRHEYVTHTELPRFLSWLCLTRVSGAAFLSSLVTSSWAGNSELPTDVSHSEPGWGTKADPEQGRHVGERESRRHSVVPKFSPQLCLWFHNISLWIHFSLSAF